MPARRQDGTREELGGVFRRARATWNGNGPGSTAENTAAVLWQLTGFCRKYHIDRLVDLGCGSFGWLEPLTAELVSYVGYDVVPEVIEQNRAAYPKLRFEVYTGGLIEECDAVLCRDVMQHLTQRQNEHLIAVAQKSSRWLIATTQGCTNVELAAAGGFRPVNLTRHPYRLGVPILLRDYGTKFLGCWDLNGRSGRLPER